MSHIVATADVGYAGIRTVLRVEESSPGLFQVWVKDCGFWILLLEFFGRFRREKVVKDIHESGVHMIFYGWLNNVCQEHPL